MKKALFDELTSSIREAGAIRRGKREPSRRFEFTADDIRATRERLHKSQSEFARMIGVTVATLQNWEQGRRAPQGPARALLVVANAEPKLVADALASSARATGGASRKAARGAPRSLGGSRHAGRTTARSRR